MVVGNPLVRVVWDVYVIAKSSLEFVFFVAVAVLPYCFQSSTDALFLDDIPSIGSGSGSSSGSQRHTPRGVGSSMKTSRHSQMERSGSVQSVETIQRQQSPVPVPLTADALIRHFMSMDSAERSECGGVSGDSGENHLNDTIRTLTTCGNSSGSPHTHSPATTPSPTWHHLDTMVSMFNSTEQTPLLHTLNHPTPYGGATTYPHYCSSKH